MPLPGIMPSYYVLGLELSNSKKPSYIITGARQYCLVELNLENIRGAESILPLAGQSLE
jgi:hypothetical protein